MNNFWDDQIIHDNIYANTYSLWGNSKFYDIKNLSPQNYYASAAVTTTSDVPQIQEFKASRWTSSPSEGQSPEYPDPRNRRIIDRESLYEDPETFYKEVNTSDIQEIENTTAQEDKITPTSEESKSPTFDWTAFYWHKANEKLQDSMLAPGPSKNRSKVIGPNKIQKKLDKMLAKPVKMTKAENMMQKMGWQGGALGRSGDGIVEPIAPNAVYAKKKIGFGQNHVQIVDVVPPKIKKADSKQFFDMNVLLNIYEFIKNNSELELLFDRKLKKEERKRIHNLVQFKIKADDLACVDFDSNAQMDLVLQINERNCYRLHTQSEGRHPYRQLCIYKEAPLQVYLIVPDDLRDDPEEELAKKEAQQKETEIKIPEPEIEEEEMITEELEEETNPFLISITRNLKKQKTELEAPEVIPAVPDVPAVPEVPALVLPEMSKIMSRIVEYYMEFTGDKKYSEFKFLGPFTEEEISAINEFLEQAVKFLNKEDDCPLACIFEKVAFDINEDCTGNTVLYKRPV